jgi:putative FmdB family regulatory protein
MPLYEFQCDDCGDVVEVLVKVNGRGPRKCGRCSGRLKKMISRTSFHLKGGGWYSDGYGGGAKSSDKPKTESKSDGKSSASDKSKKAASA